MKKGVLIRVRGKVQGVGFRFHTLRRAHELGVTGYVMNEPDRSVTIAAEGDEKILEEFIQWCQSGPRHASVEEVEIHNAELHQFQDFRIR